MGIETIPCAFGEERRIKSFDVFVGCFLCVFGCLEERKKKKRVEKLGKAQNSRKKKCVLSGLKGVGG